jgi:hypothetical protein
VAYESIPPILKAALEEIPNVGVIHLRNRVQLSWEKILELYLYTTTDGEPQYRAWNISLEEVEVNRAAFGMEEIDFAIVLQGVMSFHDEENTEYDFLALLELVLRKLMALPDTQFVASIMGYVRNSVSTVRAVPIDIRQFGAAWCHFTEISFHLKVDVNTR